MGHSVVLEFARSEGQGEYGDALGGVEPLGCCRGTYSCGRRVQDTGEHLAKETGVCGAVLGGRSDRNLARDREVYGLHCRFRVLGVAVGHCSCQCICISLRAARLRAKINCCQGAGVGAVLELGTLRVDLPGVHRQGTCSDHHQHHDRHQDAGSPTFPRFCVGN